MNVELGMHIYTSDGKDLGTVDRLILDPDRGTVKAAVVRNGVLLHRDVEVPIEIITTSPSGDATIALASEKVDQLTQFQEASYTTPPADYAMPTGYPPSSVFWPAGFGGGAPRAGAQAPMATNAPAPTGSATIDRELADALRRQDLENAVIGEGSDVLGRDGKKVGTVRDLTFDPDTSKLTSLVVHKGLIAGKDAELPASLIEAVDDGVVLLKVDAKEAVK